MARGRVWAWSLSLVLAAIASPAVAEPAGTPQAPLIDDGVESFHERRLANGMRVLIGVDHSAPLVGVKLAYAVGDVHDPVKQPGLARMIGELLAAAPTRHLRGDGRRELIEAAGFHPWRVTSWSGIESTTIALEVPAAALELALYIEADRMGFAADGVDADRFRDAANAADEELKGRDAGVVATELLARAAYGADHPYARQARIGGAEPFALVDLRERLRRHYNPANATLALVGDVEPQAALALVERWFGALPGSPAPRVPALPPGKLPTTELEIRARDVEDGAGLAWVTPAFLSDDDITLDVVARYLGRRLLPRLPSSNTRITVRQVSMRAHSVFVVCGPLGGVASAEQWRELVTEEIAKLAAEDVDLVTLRNARDAITQDIATSSASLTGRAGMMITFDELRRTPDFFGGYLGGYRATDAPRAAATARRLLAVPPRTFLRFKRDEQGKRLAEVDPLPAPTYAPPPVPGRVQVGDALIWYRPPVAGASRKPVLPVSDDTVVKGGTRVLTVTRPGLPTASVTLQVAWRTTPPNEYVFPLLRDLVGNSPLQPTVAPAAATLPDTLYRAVAPFGGYQASTDPDELQLTVTVVPERVDEVLQRFGQVLALRRFSIERFVSGRQGILDANLPSLRARSWRNAQRVLNPVGHRYAPPPLQQSRERLAALSIGDVERYWADAVRPDAVSFAVVGPVQSAPIRARVEQIVAGLPRPKTGPKPRAAAARAAAGHGVHVFTSDSEKETDLLVIWPMPAPTTSGHTGAHLLRWVLGTTLWNNLDEQRISVSDTGCNYWSQREQSLIYAALRVAPEHSVSALQAVFRSAEALKKDDFSWVAFADARREAAQWVTQRLTGVSGLNGLALSALSYGHSLPAFSELYETALRYERAQLVRDALRFDPKLATVIVNGRFTRTPGELEALGVGAVNIQQAEGAPR